METMKKAKAKKYYIKDVERLLNVQRETLFYWETTKKIPKAKREVMSRYRYWTKRDIELINKIKEGKVRYGRI